MSKATTNEVQDIFGDNFNSKGSSNSESDFSSMFENSMMNVSKKLEVGQKIVGEILTIGKDEVFVSTGTLNDGVVLKSELLDSEGSLKYKLGDSIELYVCKVKDSDVLLSTKPTTKNLIENLEDAHDMMLPVEGKVAEVVNGGFRVQLKGKLAFCPISQMDSKRIDKPEDYIGKKFQFIITKFEGGRNIVVSRRKQLDEERQISESTFLDTVKPGKILKGVVSRLEKFGAFVEVAPCVEGLVHISELKWSRIQDPTDAVQIGQQVEVKVLKIEDEGGRLKISLSLKQAEGEPWSRLPQDLQPGKVVSGKVTRCMKFGAFVEIAPGIEGLVPLSEMSYTKRVLRSDELFKEGDTIAVMIKDLHLEEKKVLLSLKDAGNDPWAMVSIKYPTGSLHKGKITRREPYGLFVQLEEGVIGLLPKAKAQEQAEFPFEKLKLGDEVIVQISEIKFEERKLSLGVPQDPDAEVWKSFSPSPSASFGTFADQFTTLFKKS